MQTYPIQSTFKVKGIHPSEYNTWLYTRGTDTPSVMSATAGLEETNKTHATIHVQRVISVWTKTSAEKIAKNHMHNCNQ